MNTSPATITAEPVAPELPPMPDYKPEIPEEKPHLKLFDRVRQARTATTDKLREKADSWREKADAEDAAEAEEKLAKTAKGDAKEVAKDLVAKRRKQETAQRKVETGDDSAIGELEQARKELDELKQALAERMDRGGKYAEVLEKQVTRNIEKAEHQGARRAVIRQFRRSKASTKRMTRFAWMTGISWTISGGVLIASYDRFLKATGMTKMHLLPRAEYLASGGTPHTWDLFTGVPYQMREWLQMFMEIGSGGGWLAVLLLAAGPVAAAEYWRAQLTTRWLMWALRVPMVGYLTGFIAFVVELGPKGVGP